MSWDSWSESGPHSTVFSFSFSLLPVSCGFRGILSPGGRSEYHPGLPLTVSSWIASASVGGRSTMCERMEKEGSRVLSVGRLWAVPGWAAVMAMWR